MRMNWNIGEGDFESAMSRYDRYLRGQDLSELSMKRYLNEVKRFLTFAKDSHPSIQQAYEFREHLIEEKVAPSSINTICHALKKFYSMHGEKFEFKSLRVRNTIPFFFNEDEVGRIFDAASHNIKHLTMLQTLFYGCLRANELCELEDRDLDLSNLTIRIRHGKGDKEGIVMITPRCAQTLRRYLSIRPSILVNGRQYLFFTDYGDRWDRVGLYGIFYDIKKRAKVSSPGMLHVFGRHTPATLMIAHGADIRVVQTILRHNDIKTTLRYAHVSDTTKRTMYDKYLTV
jgi:integrase/recombinase XerD